MTCVALAGAVEFAWNSPKSRRSIVSDPKRGLQMKYFVLKPEGQDVFARASRRAMRIYAGMIEPESPDFAKELREWADSEFTKAVNNGMVDMIRGSLEGYPNHGGDIGVMTEVERIEKLAESRGRDAAIIALDQQLESELSNNPQDFGDDFEGGVKYLLQRFRYYSGELRRLKGYPEVERIEKLAESRGRDAGLEEAGAHIDEWMKWYAEEFDSGVPTMSVLAVMRAMLPRLAAGIRVLKSSVPKLT